MEQDTQHWYGGEGHQLVMRLRITQKMLAQEKGGQQQKPMGGSKTKGQPSPPPHPIEIRGGLERQVSKSRCSAPPLPGSSLWMAQRLRVFYFWCMRVCFGAQGPPSRG